MYDPKMRKDCPMRETNGNCSPVGGFCMDAISDEICEAVHNAYQHGYCDALAMLKEQEAVQLKTIPDGLKQKMWNALYAEEDKYEKKYISTEEHDGWFLIYRPWLQKGFNLAIEAIANWEWR